MVLEPLIKFAQLCFPALDLQGATRSAWLTRPASFSIPSAATSAAASGAGQVPSSRASRRCASGPTRWPRPDLAVCRGRADGYGTRPPVGEDVFLVVDLVTDPSHARWRVGWPICARWRIPLARIADLARDEVRIAREPTTTGYARIDAYRHDEVLAPPLAFSVLAVADILG